MPCGHLNRFTREGPTHIAPNRNKALRRLIKCAKTWSTERSIAPANFDSVVRDERLGLPTAKHDCLDSHPSSVSLFYRPRAWPTLISLGVHGTYIRLISCKVPDHRRSLVCTHLTHIQEVIITGVNARKCRLGTLL